MELIGVTILLRTSTPDLMIVMVRSEDLLAMSPSNDHELAIARIVDKLSIDGKFYPTAIEDVITVLGFSLSKSDSEFLVSYIRWRMDNPIAT